MNRKQRRASKGQNSSQPNSFLALQGMFNEALAHHQAGRLPEAEQLYRQILALEPRHADSLHLLGVLAQQVGRHDIALELIGRAIATRGGVPFFITIWAIPSRLWTGWTTQRPAIAGRLHSNRIMPTRSTIWALF